MLSVGKKPPPETKVILIFKELNNLIPDIFSKVKMIILKIIAIYAVPFFGQMPLASDHYRR